MIIRNNRCNFNISWLVIYSDKRNGRSRSRKLTSMKLVGPSPKAWRSAALSVVLAERARKLADRSSIRHVSERFGADFLSFYNQGGLQDSVTVWCILAGARPGMYRLYTAVQYRCDAAIACLAMTEQFLDDMGCAARAPNHLVTTGHLRI